MITADRKIDRSFLSIQDALRQGTKLLENASVGAARLTAEVLLAHAVQQSREYLYAHATDSLTRLAWIHYGRYLNERLKGKPTQYITHAQEFFGRKFYVNENVLIPRPETEHLVETAIEYVCEYGAKRIIDVGTGSGAIANTLSLECSRRVFASDISAAALKVARRNRDDHGANVLFFEGDLLQAVEKKSIDLLVSNPPYVPGADAANMQVEVREWEPHVALFACDNGFEIYRNLIAQAEDVVKLGGRIMMELGYRSLEMVKQMLSARWSGIDVVADLAGWPRVIAATLSEKS